MTYASRVSGANSSAGSHSRLIRPCSKEYRTNVASVSSFRPGRRSRSPPPSRPESAPPRRRPRQQRGAPPSPQPRRRLRLACSNALYRAWAATAAARNLAPEHHHVHDRENPGLGEIALFLPAGIGDQLVEPARLVYRCNPGRGQRAGSGRFGEQCPLSVALGGDRPRSRPGRRAVRRLATAGVAAVRSARVADGGDGEPDAVRRDPWNRHVAGERVLGHADAALASWAGVDGPAGCFDVVPVAPEGAVDEGWESRRTGASCLRLTPGRQVSEISACVELPAPSSPGSGAPHRERQVGQVDPLGSDVAVGRARLVRSQAPQARFSGTRIGP